MVFLIRRTLLGSVLCLAAASAMQGAAAGATPASQELVGEWTDFGRLEFSGQKTFPPHELRLALACDMAYLLASHPQAPRAKLLPALEERLTAGFQHGGFPDASVRATIDEPVRRVRIDITEGARYRCGEVKVRGAVTVPVPLLVRRLTEKWPPPSLQSESNKLAGEKYLNSAGKEIEEEEPDWKAGDPAPFDAATLENLTQQFTNTLAKLGYFMPKVKSRIQIRANSSLADWLIDIESEGPHGKLGRIEVSGLKRNSSDAVLKWLGLSSGQPVGHDLVGGIERQLWNSGRFLTYRVQPVPAPDKPDQVDLDLWLEELPEAPLLGQDFSREEQVLMKFREWLLTTARRGDDLVASVRLSGLAKALFGELELIHSGQGFLAVSREGGTIRNGLMVVARGRMEFFTAAGQRKLSFGGDQGSTILSVSVAPDQDTNKTSRFNFNFGAGMSSKDNDEAGAQPVRLDFLLAPVAFVHMAHPTNGTMKLEGKVLSLSVSDATLKIDAATGGLIELAYDEGNDRLIRAVVKRGAFERTRRELESASAALPNVFDTNRPFSSAGGVLGAELFQLLLLNTNSSRSLRPTNVTRAVAAAERVYTQAFAALDPLYAMIASTSERFHIPRGPFNPDGAGQLATFAWALSPMLGYVDQLLPAQSWPRTLVREALFVMSGEGRYTQAELQRLYEAEETGPVGCLVAAYLLDKMEWSSARKHFAVQGLLRMSAADFRKDCQWLLDKESTLGRIFLDGVQALRDLPAEDLEALAALQSEQGGAFLRRMVSQLNSTRAQPAAEALGLWLEELWQSGLRERVDKALRTIGGSGILLAAREKRYRDAYRLYEKEDYKAAAKAFQDAAERDHPDAQLALARMLQTGKGLRRDSDAALYWTYRAASNSVTEAQLALGAQLSTGLEGPDGMVEAYYWYSLAADSGDKAAETLRNNTRRKLTPEQLKEAERRLAQPTTAKPPVKEK